MQGLRIDFKSFGAELRLDALVHGADAEIQNLLVNVGTLKGSDHIYEERGTDLLKDAVAGAIVDSNSAQHSANFAALASMNFMKTTLPSTMKASNDRISEMTLEVESFDGNLLTLQAQFVTADKRVIGVTSEINV